MREIIKEYLELNESEKSELWSKAIFVFDTNVFLNLYRYSKDTRDALEKAMETLSDRIWMPKQVVYEFMRNRLNVIEEESQKFDKLHQDIEKFKKDFKEKLRLQDDGKSFKDLCKCTDKIDDWIDKYKQENHLVQNSAKDDVLEKLLNLFDNKTGQGFNDDELKEICADGKERYEKQIPPGYKDASKQKGKEDNNQYGDLIIWKELLRYSNDNKKDIIFVCHDQKEDWWNNCKGKTIGPRVELRKEFMDFTQQKFHMYTMDNFINMFNDTKVASKIEQRIIDEVKNIEDDRILKKSGYHTKNLINKRTVSSYIRDNFNNKINHLNLGDILSNDNYATDFVRTSLLKNDANLIFENENMKHLSFLDLVDVQRKIQHKIDMLEHNKVEITSRINKLLVDLKDLDDDHKIFMIKNYESELANNFNDLRKLQDELHRINLMISNYSND